MKIDFGKKFLKLTKMMRLLFQYLLNKTDNANVLDFVELYIIMNILTHIVNATNQYAQTYLKKQNEKVILANGKIPVDKKKIGLIIFMRIIHNPNINMYWSTDELYYASFFSKITTRDNFFFNCRRFYTSMTI